MDMISIPFHDWRKCLREGFRTRDGHIMEHLLRHPAMGKMLIVNRPITHVEMLLKRSNWRTRGKVIAQGWNFQLAQVAEKGYVLDYLSLDSFRHVLLGKRWYYDAYARDDLLNLIYQSCDTLEMESPIGQGWALLASGLCKKLSRTTECHFYPDDNFLQLPSPQSLLDLYAKCYGEYAEVSPSWVTNSYKNSVYFPNAFKVNCEVIPNGVDPERFRQAYTIPTDLRRISKPIIGFGGKITHLVDTDLLNSIVENSPDKSFVIVGQALEKNVFKLIRPRPNLYYLGDKHYDEYPAYVAHFDVCILPYVVGKREHGEDSIKVYEYLAAGKPVVATDCSGVDNVRGYLKIANSPNQFSELINLALAERQPPIEIPKEFTWEYKTDLMLRHCAVLQIADDEG